MSAIDLKRFFETRLWLIMAGATVYLCAEYFLLGPYSAIPTHDNAEQYIPIYINHARQYLDPGFWFPFAAAGVDRLSLGYFNGIDTILFDLFHPIVAFSSLKILHVACALAGIYLLARHRLSLDVDAAAFAALTFAIGASAGHLFGSVRVLTPLLIFLTGYALDGGRTPWRWAGLAAGVVIFTFTAFPQFLVPFTSVFIVLWFLVLERRKTIGAWATILAVAGVPPLLRLQDFLSLAVNAPLSNRTMDVVETGFLESLPWLGRQLVPHSGQEYLYFLLGALGFVVIVLADRKSVRLLGLFLACIATALFLILLKALFADGLLSFAKGFNVVRLMQFTPMILALAAGFAYRHIHIWATRYDATETRRAVPLLLVGAWIVASLGPKWENLKDWVSQGNHRNNIESPLIRDLAARIGKETPPPRVAAHQYYASYLPAYGLEITGGALTLFPRRYREFWELVIAPMKESDPEMYSILAANKLRLRMTTYRNEAKVDFARYYNLDLLSLANTRYVLSRDELVHPDLTAIRNDSRNWSSLSRPEKIKEMLKANLEGRDLMKIYDNRRVLPRVFAPRNLRLFETKDDLLHALGNSRSNALKSTLLVSKADVPAGISDWVRLGEATANIVGYNSDEIILSIAAGAPSIIVVANSYSPFWQCRSELLAASMFPAYHTFWAIPVKGGEGRVVCRYAPPYSLSNLSSWI